MHTFRQLIEAAQPAASVIISVALMLLSGFLMTNNLCWLFWLLCLTLAGGLAALFRPRLQSLFGRLRHRLAHRQPSQPPAEE